jgi:folate-dependent phosphoribosylglycinamide formyltransferase PurN
MSHEKTVMLWLGASPNHQALACRIASSVPVTEIIVERRVSKRDRRSLRRLLDGVLGRSLFRSISTAWRQTQNHYAQAFPSLPATRILEVEDIHSPLAREFARSSNAEIVAVSGTRMIRSSMLDESSHRNILNLHTGLSPFVKGGPNCTNWCVARKAWHLIGNSVMWIDAGIDSGDLVTTETVPLLGTESFSELHLKVLDHAHSLYVKAIHALWEGRRVPRVKQAELGQGVTFYSRQWNAVSKTRMLLNFRNFGADFDSNDSCRLREAVETVSLDAA